MSELMQACVEVWESDPAAYHYNPVGYIALGAAVQEDDLIATYERQERIGYRSELIVGAGPVDEHQGGFAFNLESVNGLVGKCESEGVTVVRGVEVQALELEQDGSVTALGT